MKLVDESVRKDQKRQKYKHRADLLFIAGAALFFMIWAWQWNRFDLGLDGPDGGCASISSAT